MLIDSEIQFPATWRQSLSVCSFDRPVLHKTAQRKKIQPAVFSDLWLIKKAFRGCLKEGCSLTCRKKLRC